MFLEAGGSFGLGRAPIILKQLGLQFGTSNLKHQWLLMFTVNSSVNISFLLLVNP